MAEPNHEAIERKRKRGRGEGTGADYLPWIKARESRSRGVLHRCHGHTTGRMHEFLSTLEYRCFMLLEWNPRVIDIREQYPLHPIDETRGIAAALGVRHPALRKLLPDKTNYREESVVMTTDFLVTLAPGSPVREVMIAVKPCAELRKQRVLQKLEIERVYAGQRSVPWRLATERELPIVLTDNLDLILPCRTLDGFDLPLAEVPALLGYLYSRLSSAPHTPLAEVCSAADQRMGLERGASLTLTWHAIATRVWRVNLHKKLDPGHPLPTLHPGPAMRGTVAMQEMA